MNHRSLSTLCILGTAFSVYLIVPSFTEASPGERIRRFDSQITVEKDASMTVREALQVHSEGIEIRHGIYRDFPTTYKDPFGHRYVVDFSLRSVLRDGHPEGYLFQKLSNGLRIYIGEKDRFLPPGDYTYTLTYKTNRQLGFFRDHDELYWNVTGNGWNFPIDQAEAIVILPGDIPKDRLTLNGYTGPQGSKVKEFWTAVNDDGTITFSTTTPLQPREGFTIVVSWPKGIVAEPLPSVKLGYLLRDNRGLVVGLLGLLVLMVYYLLVWARFGRDPQKGTVMPLYDPPNGLSPAAVRYLMKMGFDHKVFAATLINMAVKRFLSICEDDGVYTLERDQADTAELAPEEKKIAEKLLGSRETIKLEQENHEKISGAIHAVEETLRRNLEKNYFVTNWQYFTGGLGLSAAVVFLSSLQGDTGESALFISVWLTFWTFGVTLLLKQVLFTWRQTVARHGLRFLSKAGESLFLTLFSIPFVLGEFFGLSILSSTVALGIIVLLVTLVFVNLLFYHLLKAPTRAGRALMDKIEGFKMFLSATEKDRLKILNPPGKTPELFERYLPYALALDVEQAWAKQFADALSRSTEGADTYTPLWYSGPGWRSFDTGGFVSSLGSSLSSAISSSSTAPGSSSGGGGGGSSGGGGGGGGGGGW